MPGEALIFDTTRSDASLVEVILKYDGKDVDDGTMPIDDVITALQGFANAYGKMAAAHDPRGQHEIRVAAINRSSFAVCFLAWVAEHQQIVIGIAVPVTVGVIKAIVELIKIKKTMQGQEPASVKIDGNNNTVILTTAEGNTSIVVPVQVYEVYKSKELDGELSKLVSPLKEGSVETLSLSATAKATTI